MTITRSEHREFVRHANRPRIEIDTVLEFWTRFGGGLDISSVYRRPEGQPPGRFFYHSFPPVWLRIEKLRAIRDASTAPVTVPVLVNIDMVPLTERFLEFYREHDRAVGPVSIGFVSSSDGLSYEERSEIHPKPEHPIVLSEEEEEEFARNRYKSREPIEITGHIEGLKGNVVRLAGKEVIITDAPFKLFLRLVIQLQEAKDGFLALKDLKYGEGIDGELELAPDGIEQALSRLRKPFAGRAPKKFIERNKGRVRLSTHRACVTWNRELLLHPDSVIQQLAERLPEAGSSA